MRQTKGYYVYVTNNCNLRCSYCDNVNNERDIKKIHTTKIRSDEFLHFVLNDDVKKNEDKVIIFFGGEPLLGQEYIKEVIGKYKKKFSMNGRLKFMMQTNGVLLNKIDKFIAQNLDYIFISIDGEKIQHDKYRGEKTFERIMKNFLNVKENIRANTTARITLTSTGSLLASVFSLIQYFDNIFWQIENSQFIVPNLNQFSKRYKKEIKILLDYWLDHLRNGIMLNIIPFQAIVWSFLEYTEQKTFRCGSSGSGQLYIDLEGNCYLCNKLMDEKEFMIGNVYDGVSSEDKFIHTEINHACKKCSIKFVCGGRCLPQVLLYPREKFRFYCDITKNLVKEIEKRLPEIKHLLSDRVVNKSSFDNPAIELTEQIP